MAAVMRRRLPQLAAGALFIILVSGAPARLSARTPPPAQRLEKANVLPLALDEAFEFRKTEMFLNDPNLLKANYYTPPINFERQRLIFGAVTNAERHDRRGHYFTFFWRTKVRADVTIRFEYRQQNLGDYVQARERQYQDVRGTEKSEFDVIGDDYDEDGRITSWRAVMIQDGKIVALTQSFLWR